ncbi:hypothetical protein DXG01_015196 [Tephrocybe rancida]|nr:hypothetical protein DXG01_015196 [Tephrocybe rancida]
MASTTEPESEYSQSVAITFEWTLRGLKNLFDSSRGETKSKPTKSLRFGAGRWQILFYANAGTNTKEGSTSSSDGGGYVSLYLSCEPTQEEKDAAAGDGGNLAKTTAYNLKEAHNHTFSHKTSNWGWAQFAKRDTIYYNANGVKNQDAFIILCTITSSPAPVTPPPTYRTQSVPKRLLETVGALLDDPLYSDVEFVIPGKRGNMKSARKILASRTLLKRADYFESSEAYCSAIVFGSGFAEGSADLPQAVGAPPSVLDSEFNLVMHEFEDSDDEEDGAEPAATQPDPEPSSSPATPPLEASSSMDSAQEEDNEADGQGKRNVRAKLTYLSSPRSNHERLPSVTASSNPRLSVVVKDVAYTTYMALLYYLYTDIIVFAPLSSSFISKTPIEAAPDTVQSPTPSEDASTQKNSPEETATSRRQWVKEWKEDYPDRPSPCSAKAMYRLADRIDLPELKARASQHIVKSLTVDNIAYEIFTPFAATFDEIRKVEVDFFLAHWKDIRASDSMRNVWQQIRNGRHPGFEEVWPLIASNLEFRPSQKASTGKTSEAAGDISR